MGTAERTAPVGGDGLLVRDGLRTGEVAAAAGVNVQTLRYYERRKLLASPGRTPGGHRVYPVETVTLVRAIKTAQRLGFTLQEVAEILDAGRHRRGGRPDTSLRARAADKLTEIDNRIKCLTATRDTLRAVLRAGCENLVACAAEPSCPLPFAE